MSYDPHPPKVSRRRGSWGPAIGVIILIILLLTWLMVTVVRGPSPISYGNDQAQSPTDLPVHQALQQHPVNISVPEGPPKVLVADPNGSGNAIEVSCTTCHATREPDYKNVTSDDLDEFHQNLSMGHGDLSCLSCHNPKDYDTLKKADGSAVSYPNVMQLCGQCHQSRYNDYLHGAHGGMTGHWDLSKGPRQRKACIDCHDPHSPAIPKMLPQFKPLDRFMDTPHPSDHQTEASHE